MLLDDAREADAQARLLTRPAQVIETRDPAEVTACIDRLKEVRGHAAGFLAYEAGFPLEPAIGCFRDNLWMTNYEASVFVDGDDIRLEPFVAADDHAAV